MKNQEPLNTDVKYKPVSYKTNMVSVYKICFAYQVNLFEAVSYTLILNTY